VSSVSTFARAAAAAGVAAAAATATAAGAGLPLARVATVPLPGPAVRFDYQSFDPRLNRLYIAHMNAGRLLAFDVRRRKVVKSLPAPGVHGVIVVPALGRAYASATDARQVLTIDSRTGSIVARTPAGDYPDGLAYDPEQRHVFVSDETGGVETVIDWQGRKLATIRLGGEAGNVQYDPGSRRILVAVQTRSQLAVIDPRTNRIVRRVQLPDCYAHGLYVDSPRRLAFVACESSATLLTVDLRHMRVTNAATIGESPDVLAFDPGLRRLYVASESGEVAVFAVQANGAKRLGLAMLAPHAHSVAVDPRSHLVYFPLESGSAGRPELLIMRPTR
jgi:DNA-binding beta-propeller fold protein YncE